VSGVAFTEDWYSAPQLDALSALCRQTTALDGIAVELGVWEGRSALQLAQVVWPRPLHCVDTWRGNLGEGPDHPTVTALAQRNVLAQFRANVAASGLTNIVEWVMDGDAFLRGLLPRSVRFCHVDASHDYASVVATLRLAIPLMSIDGILCGDDYAYPDVARAVFDIIPQAQSAGSLWWWVAP
jgi:hypothetical protein